jgi:adenosylhomocysteine nucleosidase
VGLGTLSQPEEQEVNLKHIGIVVAMTAEARSLVRKFVLTDEVIHVPEGVVIQLSGMGAQRAERAANNLLKYGAAALLSWGTAGGLVPSVSPGSLVIPSVVIGADQCSYPTHPAWHERLFQRLKGYVDLYQGILAESVTLLKSSTEKRVLFERTGAIAVDLESRSVAGVAQEARVPFMAIRAIADPADMAIPQVSLAAVDEFGQINLLRFIRGLLKHPLELFPMIRLGRNFRAAQATLATVAYLVGSHFLVPE